MTMNEPEDTHLHDRNVARDPHGELAQPDPGLTPEQREDTADAGLKELFTALRKADASLTPDLDSLLAGGHAADECVASDPASDTGRSRVFSHADQGAQHLTAIRNARSRRSRTGLLRFGLPLAAAAALVLVLTRTGTDADFRRAVLAYTSSPALGAWSSPTDFLLHTPGRELLTATPRIGQTGPWPQTPDAQPASGDSTKGD